MQDKFKNGEFVLISDGGYAFLIRMILDINIDDGTCNISNGITKSRYSISDVHKCPNSIKKLNNKKQ